MKTRSTRLARAILTLAGRCSAAAVVMMACGCAASECWQECCPDDGPSGNAPLGSWNQSHYDAMQANGEAADFVIGAGEFEPNDTVPNAAGRDHILEIAARMEGTPFPVLIEPGPGDPDLDAARRDEVVRVLTNLGNADAAQRTIISRPYSDGRRASEL